MSDATQTNALQQTPFFAGLPAEELEAIADVGNTVTFEPGDVIVAEGEMGDGMYVVLSGTAEVDIGGRFHTLTPGDFFGEMALISSRKRIATVTATERVDALRIPADAFQAFLLEHPSVAVSMLKEIVDRLREVEQRIDAWMAN
ncbi:MAG: cyclic nucleotide-binding domain-containing protein [Actinomycetota bacterium]